MQLEHQEEREGCELKALELADQKKKKKAPDQGFNQGSLQDEKEGSRSIIQKFCHMRQREIETALKFSLSISWKT